MNSSGHRANILMRSFREIGIGIETGAARPALRRAVGRHLHHRLRLPPIEQGLRRSPGGGGALLASAAPWPTSSPSTPSTTRSTASAACRPSSRRPTTSSTPSCAPAWPPARPTTSSRSTSPRPTATATPTRHAAQLFGRWQAEEILVRDPEPALWALAQDYTGPDGNAYTRKRLLRARARRGLRPRPHPPPRAHPPGPEGGPAAAHARHARQPLPHLLASTTTPPGAAWSALRPHTETVPWGEVTDDDGTQHRLWRVADGGAAAAVTDALRETELLIADGHHRYETARVYADEIGGEGEHRYVLMCLVALQDPGLTVFPTHRLLTALPDDKRVALREALQRDWEMTEIAAEELQPTAADRRPHPRRLPRRPPPPPADADPQGPRDRRRRAARACPSPTAGSTPPCSRR